MQISRKVPGFVNNYIRDNKLESSQSEN